MEKNLIHDQVSEELVAVTFEDIETIEEIVTGGFSGIQGCCIDVDIF